MEQIDKILKELPTLEDGETPSFDDLIYNLNALQGMFLSMQMKNALQTVWWAEQIIINPK